MVGEKSAVESSSRFWLAKVPYSTLRLPNVSLPFCKRDNSVEVLNPLSVISESPIHECLGMIWGLQFFANALDFEFCCRLFGSGFVHESFAKAGQFFNQVFRIHGFGYVMTRAASPNAQGELRLERGVTGAGESASQQPA